MSVSYHVYVGPFIEAHNPKKPSFKEYHGCPNNKCKSFQKESSSKFCPHCGATIALLKVPTQEPIRFDLYEETKDRLFEVFSEYKPEGKEEYEYYAANTGKIGESFWAYDRALITPSPESITADVDKFQKTFAKEIARVKEVFGGNAVNVRWGVVAYAC